MKILKKCSVCDGPTYAEFGICKRNKKCFLAYNSAHQKRNRQQFIYGLSPEVYQKLWDLQDGKCGICGKVLTKENVRTDHDHSSNTVRGLLCHRCNIGLGYFDDDREMLIRAIEYLE